ncbi:MAG: hypothetical protein JHC28_05875 [Thermoprotei archaeon]|jgi:uncharacterized membrane protein|nr:hypothetical protein [Thermoprotei archaeon]
MGDNRTLAFVLSLTGSLLVLGVGILYLSNLSRYPGINIMPEANSLITVALLVSGLLELISGMAMIVGTFMIYVGEPDMVKKGSIIVIAFSVLSVIGCGAGGLFIGFVLGLVGGIVGLTWRPEEGGKQSQQAQPQAEKQTA